MSNYMRTRRKEEGDGFFCRFTFGQFFALLVLEVFTIFFVFYLGARYGRDFLGLDKSNAADISISEDIEENHVISTADPEARKVARELIKQAKTPELKERIKRMIDNAQGTSSRERPVVVERNRAEEKPKRAVTDVDEIRSENISSDDKRKLDKEEITSSTDSSVIRVKSADNARYSVQVGSYPTMKEATGVIEKWKKKGYPSYMMIADIPDRGRWYRVRLGGFEKRTDATRYMKELQSRESVEALVVLNEQ